MNDRGGVSIELDDEVALVLLDLLSREIDERDGVALRSAVEHDGELWALNAVHIALERKLSAPMAADYGDLVGKAREIIVSRAGAWPV